MVGIITFHRAANYGAVLQSYALQQTLGSIGVESEIIDYRCEHIEQHYSPKPSVSIKHTKHFVLELMEAPQKSKIRKKFDGFLNNYLHLSQKMTRGDLSKLVNKYDTVICGSDQVWNPISTNSDYSYFLDFVSSDKKKLSYAASIGIDEWEKSSSNVIKEYLKSFDAISIREPSSLKMVESVYDGDVVVNVDPTVLLEASKWEELAEESNRKENGFVFVYMMQPSDNLYKVAEDLAREKGLDIISISMSGRKCPIGRNLKGASVNDYLWFIKNASYIVTNSFHGLIFSMIFEKRFYWDYQLGKSMSNARFDMLSKQYGIGCRCFDDNKKLNDYKELDFREIKEIMKSQKTESIQYLEKNV